MIRLAMALSLDQEPSQQRTGDETFRRTNSCLMSTHLGILALQAPRQEKELFENVKSGDVEKVRTLLQQAKGTVITARNQEGVTLLLAAAREGHTAIVEELLVQGADIEDTDKNSRTSLILAAWKGHTHTVRLQYPIHT